ncbi:MAG: hypothetical protein ABW046_22435 [Actinoplanes sp.]
MTETPNHRAPLAPGEIRTHVVGDRAFQVMHVAGGSFTQASVRGKGPSTVLATSRFETVAVNVYANAIEQAESDAVDALDDADEVPFFAADGSLVTPGAEPLDEPAAEALTARVGFAEGPTREQLAGQSALPGRMDDARREARRAAERAPAPTLADDVAALRLEIKRWAQQGDTRYGDCMAILDRIAARVPQRATWNDAPWYRHRCGYVTTFEPAPQDGGCDACESGSPNASDWQALYVMPDGA